MSEKKENEIKEESQQAQEEEVVQAEDSQTEVTEENETKESTDSEESELETVKKELSELKDTYARVHADFENIKKRLEREKYTAVEYANEKFAKDMIPVMDALDGAMKTVESEADKAELFDKLKEGIELTHKQFLTQLEKHGVTMVAEDEPFDPNIHNAIQSMDSDEVESGQIVQTFQKGYKYKNRPLREAMVVVAN
jgi:molecular chaperone GrpE